jgi:hypothetical protein
MPNSMTGTAPALRGGASFDERGAWNAVRFRAGDTRGHYESHFQRANHPTRPLAFWIRYTLTVPRARPEDAVGELWAIYFDGERGRISATQERFPLAQCEISASPFALRVGQATLTQGALHGAAVEGAHAIRWQLEYDSPEPPLLLLPRGLYDGGFPRAKSLVGSPNAHFRGALEVDGAKVDVAGWLGSQNHNWGERHTDRYAWGQVAGFDDDENSFLECASARVRVGPWRTPWLSVLVLRVQGEEYRLNSVWTAVRARARVAPYDWHFETGRPGLRIQGRIHAPAEAFVALRYTDPPGGYKRCMNSKIASCELSVERAGKPALLLRSRCRAAFELLDDEAPPRSAGAVPQDEAPPPCR